MTRRALCCLALYMQGMVAILHPACVYGQKTDSSNERDQVESAWRNRPNVVKSLILAADVVEVTKGRGEKAAELSGLFSDDSPKADRKLQSRVEFFFDGGKTAITEIKPGSGSEDGVKVEPQTFRATFDGRLNASLLEQGEKLSGSIERKGVASGLISQNGLVLAVNLWLQPQLTLKDTGWNASKFTIETEPVQLGAINCRRIKIPRDSNKWTSALDVDADKGWIPMRWQTLLDGHLTLELLFEYAVDKNVGPVIRGWKFTRYDKSGQSEVIRTATVTHYETNVNIAPNKFTIDFPIGTPIWEDIPGGRRYYVQQAGAMVPNEPRKSTHKNANINDTTDNPLRKPSAWLTIGVIVGLTVLVIRKRISQT